MPMVLESASPNLRFSVEFCVRLCVCPSFCVNAKKFLVSTHKDFLVYVDFSVR